MSRPTTVSKADIAAGVRQVGLRAGDVALLHSSLSSMGWVEGGPDTVIDAFLEVLDPARGTLVLPTLVQSDKSRPTGAPDVRRDTWDIERSPSHVGRITEVARLRPDSIRSDHFTHSVAAIGARAEEITRAHAASHGRPSPWGPAAFGFGSPWEKLYEWDAHYLFLGTTSSCNTMGHFAQAEFMRRLVEACGDRRAEFQTQVAEYNHPGAWPNFGFVIVEEWLQAKGAMRYATIGDATLRATRSRINVDTILEKLETEPETFLRPDFLEWLTRARLATKECTA